MKELCIELSRRNSSTSLKYGSECSKTPVAQTYLCAATSAPMNAYSITDGLDYVPHPRSRFSHEDEKQRVWDPGSRTSIEKAMPRLSAGKSVYHQAKDWSPAPARRYYS